MPHRAWNDKRERKNESIEGSLLGRGEGEGTAEEIAALTINEERAAASEASEASRFSSNRIIRRSGVGPARAGPAGESSPVEAGRDAPAGTAPGATAPRGERRADRDHLRRIAQDRHVRLAKVVGGAVLVLAIIVFVLENSRPVELSFLSWTFSLRLVWLVVVSLALGAIIGYVVGRPAKDLELHDHSGSPTRAD